MGISFIQDKKVRSVQQIFCQLFCIFFLPVISIAQIHEKTCIDSLSNKEIGLKIVSFWKVTSILGDSLADPIKFSELLIEDTRDGSTESKHFFFTTLDSLTFFKTIRNSETYAAQVGRLISDVNHLLILYHQRLYLIDMRHPLADLEESISTMFPDTTEAFYTTVLNKVRNVHYNNFFAWRAWVDKVPAKRENDDAEEEDYNMLNDYVETKYDPSIW